MKLEYTLSRSKRRTLSVCVTSDGKVKVNAPLLMSVREIESFLSEKSGWIENKVSEKLEANAHFADVISFKSALVCGEAYDLFLGSPEGIFDGFVCVRKLKNIKNVYVKALSDDFFREVKKICSEYGFSPQSYGFKSFKGKWGCCDGENRIFFNYKLLMLPINLQRYVIVHELCHTRYHDHSRNFWAEVRKICPECKKLRSEMKQYAFITRLY